MNADLDIGGVKLKQRDRERYFGEYEVLGGEGRLVRIAEWRKLLRRVPIDRVGGNSSLLDQPGARTVKYAEWFVGAVFVSFDTLARGDINPPPDAYVEIRAQNRILFHAPAHPLSAIWRAYTRGAHSESFTVRDNAMNLVARTDPFHVTRDDLLGFWGDFPTPAEFWFVGIECRESL